MIRNQKGLLDTYYKNGPLDLPNTYVLLRH